MQVNNKGKHAVSLFRNEISNKVVREILTWSSLNGIIPTLLYVLTFARILVQRYSWGSTHIIKLVEEAHFKHASYLSSYF